MLNPKYLFSQIAYLSLFIFLSAFPSIIASSLLSDTSISVLNKVDLLNIVSIYFSIVLIFLTILIARMCGFSNFQFSILLFISIVASAILCFSLVLINEKIFKFIFFLFFINLFLLYFYFLSFNFRKIVTLILIIFLALSIGSNEFEKIKNRIHGNSKISNFITTAFYDLKLSNFKGIVPYSLNEGGGIDKISDGYILATGDGRLYSFKKDIGTKDIDIKLLPYKVPINIEEFKNDMIEGTRLEKFRVSDILVREKNNRIEIYSSYHYWKKDKGCFVVRVSRLNGDYKILDHVSAESNWETVFESVPCLPLRSQGHPFVGQQSGGRMSLFNENQLLITIGDHEFDGHNSKALYSQDLYSSYGKVISLDLISLKSRVFSYGFRNPQGIYVDGNNDVWISEHGPQGGDELNRIKKGLNYGWPLVTYGTDYGKREWPLNNSQGEHFEYAHPVFAWVPSIAPSSIIGLNNSQFPLWKDDIILSTLKAKTLYRIRIRNDSVAYIEPIFVNAKVRDLIEGHNGELILWTHESSIIIIENQDEKNNGAVLFSSCAGCHAINDGETHGIGPDLYGVLGRKIAGAENYNYSEALNYKNEFWTKELLDQYIENPQKNIPGTSMIFQGIKDTNQRRAIIEFLETSAQ